MVARLAFALMMFVSQSVWALENYHDTLRDQHGRAIGGATVTVYLAGTATLAEIFDDDGATVKSNPFLTNALTGQYYFSAVNGLYDVTFSYPGVTFDPLQTKRIALVDPDLIVGGGGGTAQGLDQNFDVEPEITGATSANPLIIGNGTQKGKHYGDASEGYVVEPVPLGDSTWRCWTNFNCVIRDMEAAASILTIDPDATDNNKYTWGSGYGPIKTIAFAADALYTQGSATLVSDTPVVSSGLNSSYITVTDSNSDGFHRYVVMPPNWDGGTVTGKVTVVNVNATPANVFEVDISGECFPAGTLMQPSISATGEQPATITFDASGSCGASACNQNDPASATTSAITINGTPAGGNLCGFQAQVDATATTETVAGIKVLQMDIFYKINKGF